ncbi:hypothetical protein [Rhodoblastus sp.]|uniref:hypothetical protein n=1 Tax=Rhodoblastus sp. TaxID=1962975 RepID=UPI003F95CCC8
MVELRTDIATMKNVPIIWQDYIQKLMGELKKIESELKSVEGANALKLHARAQRLRNDIALLR